MDYLIEKFNSGMHFIKLDPVTVSTFTPNENQRLICRLNDQVDFHCAILPKKDGGHFINIGSAICKKLKLKEGAKINAVFTIDTTAYQFDMPEELKEVLNTDPEAYKIFHSLTEGNQRGLMYVVSQVKSSDKRIERALTIAAKLKSGIKSPRMILK